MVHKVEMTVGGKTLSLETGKIARQAQGAVMARYGDTMVLCTVLCAPSKRDIDFFPLFLDYREMTYAAGKFPGGFFKREGRPTNKEILTMRLIDRPIRPLFPDGYMEEVQIQCIVMSYDGENDPDIPALIGASAALMLSPAPFEGPVAAARIGYIDGEYVVNPSVAQVDQSDMDLVVAGKADGVNMLELKGFEVSEKLVSDGIAMAQQEIANICSKLQELADVAGKEKSFTLNAPSDELKKLVYDKVAGPLREAKQIKAKTERNDKLNELRESLLAELCPEGEEEPTYSAAHVKEAFYKTEKKVQRQLIIDGIRPDGRARDEIRPLSGEVSVLPRTHGSSIFSRGETMSLATCTLGTAGDEQTVDGMIREYSKKFMLHYNFPPFSVGEIRPIRGPGRREIGHGALAEKSLEAALPAPEDFPYTIRLVSEILESNGSSSMASVCAGTLALLDAGVPMIRPVAGISVGRVTDENNENEVLLTDIIGEEDFHGDMDFKVSGTTEGITGIQLDMKASHLTGDSVVKTLEMARVARLQILEMMAEVIEAPREEISQYAPRLMTLHINPDKIGKLIGPGGKTIRSITEETGVTIDIEDDGSVFIASNDSEAADKARALVEALTEEIKVGRIYEGKVVSVKEFGAFVELAPGQDGLCHISELDNGYVKEVSEICKMGDMLKVKVIAVDDQGRVKLSRKAAMEDDASEE